MKIEFDIEKAIQLVNKRNTTVDDICKFIFEAVENYKNIREDFHMREFKEEKEHSFSSDEIDQYVEQISKKIDKDVIKFVPNYCDKSIDIVLDAMNEKRFRTKKGPRNLIILLTTLKETYEEEQ